MSTAGFDPERVARIPSGISFCDVSCGGCGHCGDFSDFNRDFPPDHFQCPKCNVTFRVVLFKDRMGEFLCEDIRTHLEPFDPCTLNGKQTSRAGSESRRRHTGQAGKPTRACGDASRQTLQTTKEVK